jgi:hypothetical protein
MKKNTPLIVGSATAMLLSACASFAVTDDKLLERTSHALGLEVGDFTISGRSDEGTTTHYKVMTNSGNRYNCSVGGSVSVLGRSVSDAICNPVGGEAGSKGGSGKKKPCDALSKAAGKCE